MRERERFSRFCVENIYSVVCGLIYIVCIQVFCIFVGRERERERERERF